MNTKVVVLAVFGLIFFVPAQATLVLTAPPRESMERGEELYGPLAHMLSQKLGQTVVYEHPHDWGEYTLKMRQNAYDIVFDGPHLAAWRIKHLEHVPVAKLPGDLFFLVATRYSDKEITRANDLINTGTPVCGMPSPNLATIAVMEYFTNPIIQPDIYEVPSFEAGYSLLKAGKCRAVVLNAQYLGNLPAAEKAQLNVLFTSARYPNQTVTTSKRVTSDQRAAISALLTRQSGISETQELLKVYAKQAKRFEPANVQEYVGMESILEEMWGWSVGLAEIQNLNHPSLNHPRGR
ncbi:MAG: PhnD/SsuA/transferrin family substrate-binding protein [Gammaproteobacteria bacterium]|nr:PhnD/SsuA/transferrin family substrate-binding protein [Gammaproteobacteria bacterium]